MLRTFRRASRIPPHQLPFAELVVFYFVCLKLPHWHELPKAAHCAALLFSRLFSFSFTGFDTNSVSSLYD
jgi:hypothetical protein